MPLSNPNIYEKSIQHIGLEDWHAEQAKLHETSNATENKSLDLRYNAKSLMSEVNIKTVWNNRINNYKLAERLTELHNWHNIFILILERLETEIELLSKEKADTEKELELLDYPLQITMQCIAKRNSRTPLEITYDDGDIELQKELDLLEKIKKLMINHNKTAWDKINCLEDIKSKVTNEIRDKSEAIKIDTENLNLNRTFPNFAYTTHGSNLSDNVVSYDNWLEHTRYLKQQAENELSNTYTLREMMHVGKEKSKHDISFQNDATNYTLRKRAFTTQKSYDKLEKQKLEVQKEMESLQNELTMLQNTLRAKNDDIKCVETRLENRTYRPSYELCQDEPEFGLKNELIKLKNIQEELSQKINCAKTTYKDLEKLLDQVNNHLDNKKLSLITDLTCLDMRSTFIVGQETRAQDKTDESTVLSNLKKSLL